MKSNDFARLIIGGDTCPIGRNEEFCTKGMVKDVFNDVLPIFQNADFVALNLECPLIEAETPIIKGGPAIGVETGVLQVFKSAGINALGLANNHIMDHGNAGLASTLATCNAYGIVTFGAGNNLKEAEQIKIVNCKGLRIGLMGIAENEYSIAEKNSPGAAPINLISIKRQIDAREKDFDHLIVMLHGGNEYYPYPNPRLREVCHFIIELGACCVLCQHSHIAGCMEKYLNGYIVYGQGNFMFDYPSTKYSWREGMLTEIRFNKDATMSIELIPVYQDAVGIGVRLMTGERRQKFMDEIMNRSDKIDDDFIEEKWLDFCQSQKDLFLSMVLGHGKWFMRLNRLMDLIPRMHSKSALRNMGNVVRCESHREALLTIIKHYMLKD